jgi:hypothetical protein
MPESSAPSTKTLMEQGYQAMKDRHYHHAARHFEQAALSGLVEAQWELGNLYEKGLGVRIDSVKARGLFLKAANQNHILSIEKIAEYVSEGIGGHRHLDEAKQWRDKAESLRSTSK